MVYWFENGRVTEAQGLNDPGNSEKCCWGLFSFVELDEAGERFRIPGRFLSDSVFNRATRYESHDGFDYISLNILSGAQEGESFKRVCVYVRPKRILFICDEPAPVKLIIGDIADDVAREVSFERVLYAFFEWATASDSQNLVQIEQSISELEDSLLTERNRSCVGEIIHMRKRLMLYKRYYEQLLNILDEIQENGNGLYDRKALRYFKIHEGRVDRLYQSVMHMRDYVTQVREAYQAEVDISLNNIMKIFTVLTAIFFPLTLIAGWYGMNLKMPEFTWKYGYLMVIALSAAVLGGCLLILKKYRWFK